MPEKIDVLAADFVVSWPKWKGTGLDALPLVCFAGRSNVGKSSLLNCLVNRKGLARTSNTPGRTQMLNVFKILLRKGEERRLVYFVDLPGYGYAKAPKDVRAQWTPMMLSLLKDNPTLKAAVLLLDLRHVPASHDLEMFELLEECEVPTMVIATKADKIGSSHRRKHVKDICESIGVEPDDIWLFSSETKQGRDELLAEIWELAEPGTPVEIPSQ